MAAIGNGLALNGTSIPFTSTFFTFLDYMKPSIRLAALMKLNHLFIFSHDSIYVGEDGPTHQPIEQLNSLRLIPNLYTFRPANDLETAFSYLYFLEKQPGPICIITSRQKLSQSIFSANIINNATYQKFQQGGYTFYETEKSERPDIILGASGSEVALAMETARVLEVEDNKKIRIISIPCLEIFKSSGKEYTGHLLEEDKVPFLFIEASSHRGVDFFYSQNIHLIDIQSFGISAPGHTAADKFGLNPKEIVAKIRDILQ
jgi:transketolase